VLGRHARGRRKKHEPSRGHYDRDRPASIAWVSRQGGFAVREILRYASVLNCPSPADRARHARIAMACFG
jgi:hypothetical protein